MKKFVSILVAVLLVAMLASTAFAASVSASYKDGVVRWSATGIDGLYDVLLDGNRVDSLNPDHTTGQKTITLEPGSTHTITLKPGNASDTFTVPAAPVTAVPTTPVPVTQAPTTPAPATDTPAPATDTPAPATDTPAPATDTPEPDNPTATPTARPETPTPTAPTTAAPTTVAPTTVAPTTSAAADDDVPKTGDSATMAYVVGGMMVLAAAYLVLRRRVHSK